MNKSKYSYADYIRGKKIVHDENSDDEIPADENKMDRIIDGIWLGNYKAAYDKEALDDNNINYIINITDKIESPFDDKHYLIIPVRDKYSCGEESKEYIMYEILKSLDFINEALKNKSDILIHCKKGHHRSANLILFYLVYRYNIGYIPALVYINSIRKYALKRKTCINKWGIEVYKDIVNKKLSLKKF